ncbi:NapC/NirT family cytochrome c [Bacteroidota bacterium]
MKLPKTYYNPLSFLGSILAGISLALILFLIAVSLIFGIGGSYTGLFTYIVLPIFLVIGLALVPIGMVRKAKKIRKMEEGASDKWLRIDMSNYTHWNALILFTIGTFIFVFLTGIGSYEAFHYTESNEFCGTLCHSVMKPEYIAYQESSHSRVTCVECHVGEGADWYVKSKLSGLYQVYSVLFNKYPQPIPTPIHNLRPAQETCEKCHWPNKFYANRIDNNMHYLSDLENTLWNIQLKMKIGAAHGAQGNTEGFHWHINPNVQIEYIASDEQREYLPWVRYINKETGDTIIYEDLYEPLDEDAKENMEVRTMDCLDCHNRPSHDYQVPQDFIDFSIAAGEIPAELPEIKMLSMELMNKNFPTEDTALMLIERYISNYYTDNYNMLYDTNKALVEKAITGVQNAFKKNMFPEMKTSWDAYPNHIGHIEYNGCFRCHNDSHSSAEGEVISKECENCHTILVQGAMDDLQVAAFNESLEFVHPVDVDGAEKEFNCSECHRYLY